MYLGIDIGTSGVKAVAVNDEGDVVDQGFASLAIQRPRPLHSEQDPEDWWDATEIAVRRISPDRRARIRAIGLSGQMHGATFLDASHRVLRPAILWNDGRSADACAELEAREPGSRRITGNLAMPGFTAPKALWVAKHEPETFERIAKVLLPKDYIRFRMSGDFATDASDASGTLWLDVGRRQWSGDMLAASGLSPEHMPDVFEGSELTGTLLPRIAEGWGMNPVPIVAGGGDNAAGAVGVGVLDDGDAFLSLGTSGVLFVAGSRFCPNPEKGIHAFCHALPGRWHEMTVMLSAASCLDWAAKLTNQQDVPTLISLADEAEEQSVPLFLPYLSGERTPHNDPCARGVFFGMDHGTGPAEIAQSVLEGVAFGVADGFLALDSARQVSSISVIGGGSRSRRWGEILAAMLGKPLVYRRDSDVGPALGAARLARMGVTGDSPTAVCRPTAVIDQIEPSEALRDRLLPKFKRYRSLYQNTEHLFRPSEN
ncbi:xylulokinase [Parvularcula lutaonensis]|uniref:Xylulose kinase n=1 Tax=Parvularcula lutaonensis TaxID=491923 RepID=A0ABV7MBM9_9PROT|nr:xylulokinase [Parvularcula lutaonensis]GGY48818.1 xylulokinase [Parvularcula lutaonensis]